MLHHTYLDELPDELLIYHIFPELPVVDIYKMSNVSDTLKSISLDKRMWDIKRLHEFLTPIYFYNKFVGMVDYINELGSRRSGILHIIEHMKYYGYEDMRAIVPMRETARDNITENIDNNTILKNIISTTNVPIHIIKNISLLKDLSRNSIHYVHYKFPFIIKHINIQKRRFHGTIDLYDLYAIPIDGNIFLYDKEGNLISPERHNEVYNDITTIKLPNIPADRYI